MNIINIAFNTDGTITVTNADATASVFSLGATPVVAPEATEVDIILTDGTTKKFIPAPTV